MNEVLVERRGPVALVTLNRPDKRNAMTVTMAAQYADALRAADADPDIRAIVVTGAGRGFCAGADLGVLSQGGDSIRDFVPTRADLPTLALRLRKPVVVAVNGAVAGVGFAYMLGSDIRYAARDATIATSFSRLGLVAEYGLSWLLPRVVGLPNALDLLLDGGPITGEQALRIGLVHHVTESSEVVDRALEHAQRLAEAAAPYSLAEIKTQLYADQSRTLDDALADSLRRMDASFDRPDLAEALTARSHNRAPSFEALPPARPGDAGDATSGRRIAYSDSSGCRAGPVELR